MAVEKLHNLKAKKYYKGKVVKLLIEKRRRTSSPRTHRIGVRLNSTEKALLDRLCTKLDLTITDTVLEGLEALDEKYKLLKD